MFIYTCNKYILICGTIGSKIRKVFFLKISFPLLLTFQIYHMEGNSMITLYKQYEKNHIMKRTLSHSIESKSFIGELLKLPSFCKSKLAFQSLFCPSRFETWPPATVLTVGPTFGFCGHFRQWSRETLRCQQTTGLSSTQNVYQNPSGPSSHTARVKSWYNLSSVTHKDKKWSRATQFTQVLRHATANA